MGKEYIEYSSPFFVGIFIIKSPYSCLNDVSILVILGILLLLEHMKENMHSIGSWRKILHPGITVAILASLSSVFDHSLYKGASGVSKRK